MNPQQQIFNFAEQDNRCSCSPHSTTVTRKPENKPGLSDKPKPTGTKIFKIRQLLTGWLMQQQPTGIGFKVPTRISRYQADIAAFWSVPVNKLLTPRKTLIIEIRHDRETCWPDCADKDNLLELLRDTKAVKAKLEAQIKCEEPELADTNVLFEEYQGWNFHDSKNSYYHAICRKVEQIEHAIYKGSRFELIRTGQVADLLYLAVPHNSVTPHEIADGWGLLYFDAHGKVTEIKQPADWNCSLPKRQHLIQNIAAVNSKATLFKNGINYVANHQISFSQAPRRRRRFSEHKTV